MKLFVPVLLAAVCLSAAAQESYSSHPQRANTRKLFVITIDGFRWQELFTGADPRLVTNAEYVRDTMLTRQLYWDSTARERRKKLMPFFWSTVAKEGRIYGNRLLGNKVNVRNFYKISYPGYNEILTGHTDAFNSPNLPIENPHVNVLEYLNNSSEYKGKVAVFTSWKVFSFILNKARSRLPVNSGFRHDRLTFLSATEYIRLHHPAVLFLGFGETDECAHEGRYDLYLQQATNIDRMLADLWYFVQTDPYYRDSTTFLITTDHGRGWKSNKWTTHGFWANGSGETWMAVLGPDILPGGELRSPGQVYQKQLASTIAALLGDPPAPGHPPGKPIEIPARWSPVLLAGQPQARSR